jgi:hypothetical protein
MGMQPFFLYGSLMDRELLALVGRAPDGLRIHDFVRRRALLTRRRQVAAVLNPSTWELCRAS